MNPKSIGIFILASACAAAWWMAEVRLTAARDLRAKLASEAATQGVFTEHDSPARPHQPGTIDGTFRINPADFLPHSESPAPAER